MPKEKEHQGLSRRNFLKGAAFGAAGVAVTGVLGGCTTESATVTGSGGKEITIDYDVIDTDVLIVGTGNSGLAAAWQVLKEGRQVALVDKSIFRRSGASGWSWGCYSQIDVPTEVDPTLVDHLVNMPAWKNVLEFYNSQYNIDEINNPIYQINHGQTMVARQEDGQIAPLSAKAVTWSGLQYFRREMDKLTTMSSATVYDNTMITNILVNDEKCVGIVGVHVPTGRFRIFRSKATINASGSSQWINGWVKTKPVSLGGADNTGDMMGACYRLGLPMAETEWAKFDFLNAVLRTTFGMAIGADFVEAGHFVDKDNKPIFEDAESVTSASALALGVAKAVQEGRGSENGGAFCSFSKEKQASLEWSLAAKFMRENLGVDPTEKPIEVLPEMFEKFGGPLIDENLMTDLRGYFDCRGAGSISIRPVPSIAGLLKLYGVYAGHVASLYAKDQAYPEKIDLQPAIDEFVRLTEIRTKEDAAGIRPHVIRENIQKTFYKHMSLVRSKEGIEEALAEYVRIREEDMPKMVIAEHSPNWNKEWKEAIENYNLLDVAEMAVRATLFREETRYQYVREDFPDKDDANWKCFVVCRNVNGKMELSKQDIPTL